MKNLLTIFVIFLCALQFWGCDETITGSPNVDVISNVRFVITDTWAESDKLVATGTIENTGNRTIAPPFYVEGQFYSDARYRLKLGGDDYRISFSLEPREIAVWRLEFSSSEINESLYADFAVKNLRAYWK
ncbi:MAG: hypothetical protein DWQ05_05880 [Calditrichaeota bacterium]|nr:MAG: hypothetical protein DWQ05_05880 [Calditrichota bacterium]